MKCKVTPKKSTSEYPKLMINEYEEIIVLMINDEIGTVIHSNDDSWKIGDYEESWEMDGFKDFYGTIELSNDD